MGCDYYEDLHLNLEYKNENMQINRKSKILSSTPHWLISQVDSDSEGNYDRQMEKEMMAIERRYGKKIIYEDGKWLISSKSKIEEYEKFIQEYLPKDGQILCLYKVVSCYER